MRIYEAIDIEAEQTLGELKMVGFRREAQRENAMGEEEISGQIYDLKSKGLGKLIQVRITGEEAIKDFPYNTVVQLIGAKAWVRAVQGSFGEPDTEIWHYQAENMILPDNKRGAAKPSVPTS